MLFSISLSLSLFVWKPYFFVLIKENKKEEILENPEKSRKNLEEKGKTGRRFAIWEQKEEGKRNAENGEIKKEEKAEYLQ